MLSTVLDERVQACLPESCRPEAKPQHAVQFYETDEFLSAQVAEFVATGLARGEAAIVIATAPHTAALARDLNTRCVDVGVARRAGRLLLLDADETLARFRSDGRIDRERFRLTLGPVLREALQRVPSQRVRAFGEMVDLLCRDGLTAAAIELEGLWNELAVDYPFSLLCGYSMETFGEHAQHRTFQEICREHDHVLPAESYAALADDDLRLRHISALQQRACSLESEVERRKQVEVALLDALRVRDDFLAIASHELRTPVTVLALELQGLIKRAQASGDAGFERRLTRAARQVTRLTGLIAQVLDASGVDASRLQLARAPVDFSAMVSECAEGCSEQAEHAGCALHVAVEPGLMVSGDHVRLEQLVRNLLSNALKYGCHNPVWVELRRVDRQATLVVRDQGIGIGLDDQARIFERFNRAESASTFGGLGLGLWIARQVVELHGGYIRVDSAPGRGATFSVDLPLEGEGEDAEPSSVADLSA